MEGGKERNEFSNLGKLERCLNGRGENPFLAFTHHLPGTWERAVPKQFVVLHTCADTLAGCH